MNDRQLEYMLTILKEGSISKAAEILCISQPSLSQMVRKIEKETGAELFSRRARRRRRRNLMPFSSFRLCCHTGRSPCGGLVRQLPSRVSARRLLLRPQWCYYCCRCLLRAH